MTIRFVQQWNGYSPDTIVTLAGAEETRLIGLGYAVTDLDGPGNTPLPVTSTTNHITGGIEVSSAGSLIAAGHKYIVSPSGDATGAQDAAGLNAAVMAAKAAGGGVVFLCEGQYYLSDAVVVSAVSDVHLAAVPGSVKVKLADNQAAASPGDMPNMVEITNSSRCSIYGIDFDGNYQNQNMANLAMSFGDAAQGGSGNRRDPFTIRYIGAGSAASLNIAGNVLTTTCTGAAGDNLNIDLTTAGYDTIAELVAYIDGLANYTATIVHSTFGSQWSSRLYATTIADIKTAAIGVNFTNASNAGTHEIYGNCVIITSSNYCVIDSCDLSNSPHMGVFITGDSSYNRVVNCSGSYNNWRAYEVWPNAGTNCAGNVTIGNVFKNSYHDSMIIENTGAITHASPKACKSSFIGNTIILDDIAFNDAEHCGIKVYNSAYNIVSGNVLIGCFIVVEIGIADYNTIANNSVDGLNRNASIAYLTRGVYVKNGIANIVSGNICNDAYYDPIRVEAAASKTVICNNVISNLSEASRYPILIAASSAGNTLTDNRIENCVNAISDSGTRTTLNGVGQNGSNNPSAAGNWFGNGVEGVIVQWDNGGGKKRLSQYSGAAWINYYVEP